MMLSACPTNSSMCTTSLGLLVEYIIMVVGTLSLWWLVRNILMVVGTLYPYGGWHTISLWWLAHYIPMMVGTLYPYGTFLRRSCQGVPLCIRWFYSLVVEIPFYNKELYANGGHHCFIRTSDSNNNNGYF